MSDYTLNGWHFAIEEDISDIYQHWHPQSQKYAGGDQLATLLYFGWQLKSVVFVQRFGQPGGRQVSVYHFELTRDRESVSMPVVGNPFVRRLIVEQGLRLVNLAADKHKLLRPRPARPAAASGEARV